jgi:predicted dehydrogenase
MRRGDVATIFTPDDTHFDIALACIEAGLHVLCAKPLVKTLAKHRELAAAAEKHGVLCAIEYHKRFDPIYADARDRIRANFGAFSFFQSTMTQPKAQVRLLPIRPRSRGARRSLRTFPVVTLHLRSWTRSRRGRGRAATYRTT